MTSIHETAYPRLRSDWTEKLLIELFTPKEEELKFAKLYARRPLSLIGILVQLKVFQYLGRFVPFKQISKSITIHIIECLNFQPELADQINNQPKNYKSRYVKIIRKFVGVAVFNSKAKNILQEIIHKAAQTKQHIPDIINVALEELIRLKIELPAFSFLNRMSQNIRQQINNSYYQLIHRQLSAEAKDKLEKLLKSDGNPTSKWDTLKQDARKPTPNNIKEFIVCFHELQSWCQFLPLTETLLPSKISNFFLEAQSMDSAMLKLTQSAKRYALMVIYIRQKTAKVLDDMAEIVIHSLRKLHNLANEALKVFKISQTTQIDKLVTQLKQIATVYTQEETPERKFAAIKNLLDDRSTQIIAECNAQLAYTNNNYYPFLLTPYKYKRSILFDCLECMSFKSTSSDLNLEFAINFMKQNRNTKKRELILPERNEIGYFSIEWIPKEWLKLVVAPQSNKKNKTIYISKCFFELCIFSQLSLELKSGDLFIPNSEHFADYRDGLVSWDDYSAQITEYASMMKIEADPKTFVVKFYEQLRNTAHKVDQKFINNNFVRLEHDKLILKKKEKSIVSEELKQLDKTLNDRMPETNILDILVDTETWLNLSKDFRPVSGFSSRVKNPRERFIATLFCYGFNFGPTQTVRMVKNFTHRQIAWLNLRHVTEENLDNAIAKTINRYNEFMLPKQWGNGEHASVDGTKWDVYEQNLLSEFHIRYGGYGGIGYYHVSDTYIALFSHFIPCGVYEALYILDGLLKNESNIRPDKLHGDTHAQSYTVFGLAYLLGIEIMPRIRNIKDLSFYKPNCTTVYDHIEGIFKHSINWELIEKYLPDMLRTALSIKAGKLSASAILRKLHTKSRKNKLYFAFRELGRAIRTEFLLRYIDDVELRSTIHAATCKSEEFNQFLKWTFFGGDGVIAENSRYEQRKIIKYNHLVANLIILHSMRSMTVVLNELHAEGCVIDQKLLKKLAPYRTSHINRFGNYVLNLDRNTEPLNEEKDFRLNAIKSIL